MITSISITNFQSHERTTITLDPGLNVIVGSSDSGKTAILRALRWVVENKPTGDAFRSWWGGDTEVAVEFDDGTVSRARRSKTGNVYVVNGEELEGFGQGVPEAVGAAVRLSDINLQWQHDSLFMLSEPPSDVARRLNAIAKLEDIDGALSFVNSRLHAARSEERRLKDELVSQRERVDGFSWIDEAKAGIATLDGMACAAEDLAARSSGLESTLVSVRRSEAVLREFTHTARELDEGRERLATLQQQAEKSETTGETIERIHRLLSRIAGAESAMASARLSEEEWALQLGRVAGGKCPMCLGTGKVLK